MSRTATPLLDEGNERAVAGAGLEAGAMMLSFKGSGVAGGVRGGGGRRSRSGGPQCGSVRPRVRRGRCREVFCATPRMMDRRRRGRERPRRSRIRGGAGGCLRRARRGRRGSRRASDGCRSGRGRAACLAGARSGPHPGTCRRHPLGAGVARPMSRSFRQGRAGSSMISRMASICSWGTPMLRR